MGWCALLNIGILSFAFVAIAMAREPISKLHAACLD
ncbi:hypothetical protein [Novipirellula aureliae]